MHIGSRVENWKTNMGGITHILYNNVSDWYRKAGIGSVNTMCRG